MDKIKLFDYKMIINKRVKDVGVMSYSHKIKLFCCELWSVKI